MRGGEVCVGHSAVLFGNITVKIRYLIVWIERS